MSLKSNIENLAKKVDNEFYKLGDLIRPDESVKFVKILDKKDQSCYRVLDIAEIQYYEISGNNGFDYWRNCSSLKTPYYNMKSITSIVDGSVYDFTENGNYYKSLDEYWLVKHNSIESDSLLASNTTKNSETYIMRPVRDKIEMNFYREKLLGF